MGSDLWQEQKADDDKNKLSNQIMAGWHLRYTNKVQFGSGNYGYGYEQRTYYDRVAKWGGICRYELFRLGLGGTPYLASLDGFHHWEAEKYFDSLRGKPAGQYLVNGKELTWTPRIETNES